MTPKERYKKLKEHLLEENPILVEVIDEYKTLDSIARHVGVLSSQQTYTESISWWPLISILGTFSAGKSSFINEFLGQKVQETGNQAVDDKFTVICYSKKSSVTTLPGVALDADPRFPFYNISKEIEKIDPSANNINKFLQLKTVHSDRIKGKILIDSPGFDADVQRNAVLRITRHIIDLSDLVLIFFDARHPEPGAMRDTLNHLVEIAINHTDADKVLFVLNQIDTCAKEDNLEEIIGAWQRALSQKGIVSGKFYAIYNESLANIENPSTRERLKKKKDTDLAAIYAKMDSVIIDRAYRIVKNIETRAKEILQSLPLLQERLRSFTLSIAIGDIVLAALLAFGVWYGASLLPLANAGEILAGAAVVLFVLLHVKLRSFVRGRIAKKIEEPALKQAFLKHTSWLRPYLLAPKALASKKIEAALEELIQKSKSYIQKLNDQFIHTKSDTPQE